MRNKFINNIEYYDKSTDLVESNYSGQMPEQMPIYLELDLNNNPATVNIITANFNLTGTPVDIWSNRRLVFGLPHNVDATRLHDWTDTDLSEHLNAIIDSHSIEWNGSNHVGVFDSARMHAFVDYMGTYIIPNTCPTYDHGGMYRPKEWFYDETTEPDEDNPTAKVLDFVINKDTTDEEITAVAQTLEKYAEDDNVVFIGTVIDFLSGLRDDCCYYTDKGE